jgi:hypothetical protein
MYMNTSSSTEVHSGPVLDGKPFSDFLSNLQTLDFPGVILFLAIASVTISTHFIFPEVSIAGTGISTIHNGFILGAFGLYGLFHGFKIFLNPVIVGYTVILLTTFTLASYHPNLTTLQPFRSYFSLMLGVLLLHLVLDQDFRLVGMHLLVLLAPLSLAIGAVFDVLGIHEIYVQEVLTTGVYRLQGAAIPAHLAGLALFGMLASFTLAYHRAFFAWIGLLNFAIVAATVTRLYFALGFGIIILFAWPRFWEAWKERNYQQLSVLSVGGIVLLLITTLTIPGVLSRSTFEQPEGKRFIRISEPNEQWIEAVLAEDVPDNCPLRRDGEVRVNCLRRKSMEKAAKAVNMILYHDFADPARIRGEAQRTPTERLPIYTSGRLDAWKTFWNDAEENLVFGRGLGAGTVVNEGANTAFEVPHNEYLRIVVDGGFVGLAIMVATYGYLFYRVYKRRRDRTTTLMMIVAIGLFAVLAIFDNPLVAQQLSIPFWLYIAIQAK